MFTKRIIPCLDVNNGRVVKGVNFVNLRDAGDPVAAKDATVLSYALSGDEEDWQVQSNLVQLGITEYDFFQVAVVVLEFLTVYSEAGFEHSVIITDRLCQKLFGAAAHG